MLHLQMVTALPYVTRMQQLACVVPIHANLMAWNIYPGYFAVSVAQNNKLVNKMKPCCNSESAYNILYELAIDAISFSSHQNPVANLGFP